MILLMVARRNGVVDEDSDCEKKRKDGMRMMIKQKKMPMVVMVKLEQGDLFTQRRKKNKNELFLLLLL